MVRKLGITDAIKRAAMGDTAAYTNPMFRDDAPARPVDKRKVGNQFGRIYADPLPEAGNHGRSKPAFFPLAAMRRVRAALISIGDYDHARAK